MDSEKRSRKRGKRGRPPRTDNPQRLHVRISEAAWLRLLAFGAEQGTKGISAAIEKASELPEVSGDTV